ncbi:2-phosphosulfolactate phosphatase [Terrilactibacillus sp. BCM23-1]|uniref:Probable 2-phosphosulfolactate phosphatase n=1 Tax=Terrilactibacillus tamarindi TaxID=2599694 RepID=A0A6N8CLI5_9BACI|nr:2-phosphosulfolactate phosphatase [Terrilactibacillus tamarindi]MTT30641.1 2-phosphosulfolactate phosphatase [Terrilactibacillus tamarindi]
MRIDTVATLEDIQEGQIDNRTVIVIDVLRASSTIVTALESGFTSVIPVKTRNEALTMRSLNSIVAGEWHGKKLDGFDYNNSPSILKKKIHTGKKLILTTTNGTRAIEKAASAYKLLIGCFLNASACVKEAINLNRNLTLYCAGTRSEFALEDGLAAGLMVSIMRNRVPSIETCDFSKAMEACYLQLANRLPHLLYSTITGKRLVKNLNTEDIKYCGHVDISNMVPILIENRIVSIHP